MGRRKFLLFTLVIIEVPDELEIAPADLPNEVAADRHEAILDRPKPVKHASHLLINSEAGRVAHELPGMLRRAGRIGRT